MTFFEKFLENRLFNRLLIKIDLYMGSPIHKTINPKYIQNLREHDVADAETKKFEVRNHKNILSDVQY